MRLYISSRGFPLVYQDEDPASPVLTVENYPKWYAFYIVMPDGKVEEIGFGALQELADAAGVSPYVDHVPNAELVTRLVEQRGWSLDICSYEMMVGRWELEIANPKKYDF